MPTSTAPKSRRIVGPGQWVLGLALILSAVPARAESDVYATGADPLSASAVQKEQAQARFLRGKEYIDAKDYEAALREFDASRAIVASPNARLFRARCLRELGRIVEAYNEFGATWVDAEELSKLDPRYSRAAESAAAERKALEASLAFVRLSVLNAAPDTVVSVNGEQLRRSAWGEPVPSKPGPVQLQVTTPGQGSAEQRSVEVSAGETLEVTFELAAAKPAPEVQRPVPPVQARKQSAPPKPPTSLMPYAYASAGVGVVGASVFTVFGLMAKDTHQQLVERCPEGTCPEAERDALDDGKRQQLFANIGLAAGLVGISGGITLLVLDMSAEQTPGGTESQISIALKPDQVVIRGKL